MNWKQAIIQVLRDHPDGLHYQDIFRKVLERGLRPNGRGVTVNVTITNDIRDWGDNSPFEKMPGTLGGYRLRKGTVGIELCEISPTGSSPRGKPMIYLTDNHVHGNALTLNERQYTCGQRARNNGWICMAHGVLDFKKPNVRGLRRYLVQEILQQGCDVRNHPNWSDVNAPQTHCLSGTGYLGGLDMKTWKDAVKFLKKFYTIVVQGHQEGACGVVGITQASIDAL